MRYRIYFTNGESTSVAADHMHDNGSFVFFYDPFDKETAVFNWSTIAGYRLQKKESEKDGKEERTE